MLSLRARLAGHCRSLLRCGSALAVVVTVQWTAPGDNGNVGTAYQYDMRRATHLLTTLNFTVAETVAGMPKPLPAGSQQTASVWIPHPDSTCFLAMRTRDLAGNWSGMSNLVQVTPVLAVDGGVFATRLSWPFPNPARGLVKLELSLSHLEDVAVEVFDIAGRRVRVLTHGRLTAGPHELAWDLRDEAGRRVAPGQYLVMATAPDGYQVRRVSVTA